MREKKSAGVFLYPDGGNKILHNNIVKGELGTSWLRFSLTIAYNQDCYFYRCSFYRNVLCFIYLELFIYYFNFIVFLFLLIFPASRIRLITANDDIGGGRIEVYHNGQWGTICDKSWSEQAAKVACRELGFKTALYPAKRAFFGEGSGPVMTKHDPPAYR